MTTITFRCIRCGVNTFTSTSHIYSTSIKQFRKAGWRTIDDAQGTVLYYCPDCFKTTNTYKNEQAKEIHGF